MTLNVQGLMGPDGSYRTTSDYNYKNISTASTFVVKSSPGVLHAVTINTALGSCTMYDNGATATGNVIGTFTASATGNLIYDVNFATGLTVVTTSAPNLTISYK